MSFSFLGDQILTKEGLKPTSEVLAGKKAVGLYFSAHWCPPCRGFTPVLAEFYEQLKEEGTFPMEIVFVSSDSDDASFANYYGEMPWTSVPFASRDIAQALGTKFGVRGIPHLVILDAAGEIKDNDGRSTVAGARGVLSKATSKWA